MVQSSMFNEIQDKSLFELAAKYGCDYLEKVFDRPAYPTQGAIAGLSTFDEDLPAGFTPSREILAQLNNFGAPASVAQVGGRYFGFVNGGVVPAGLASRLMTDFWDQNTAMQVLSPVCSKLETVVQKWLRQLLRLPNHTVAGFVSGTSMATFCGLAAARFRILKRAGWDINDKGLWGAPRLRIVTGRQIHSTVIKAIALLGFGKESIEWVDTDNQGRIKVERLPAFDDHTIVILQAGNVNTGSFDDFDRIGDKANAANAWVHIDGAFGLWAAAVEELRHLAAGIEKANSWSVDGHKTLNTPYDNGIVLCRDEDALVSALHMSGSYIVLGEERDGMFYTPEMSRRARIIELWATLKSLGHGGIREMIYGLHQRAKQFAIGLERGGFEIVNEIGFNQVLVHYKNSETTQRILKHVQELGVCWCGGSKWNDQDVIRISVCSWATTEKDVVLSVDSFLQAKEMAERNP